LLKRVSSTNVAYQMPPVDAHLGALTPQEIDLFRQWIKEGAPYERHWAFTPPVKAQPPASDSKWPKNEIDYFVLARLEKQGLQPNDSVSTSPASRRHWNEWTPIKTTSTATPTKNRSTSS
jgi:hypothetical protein